MLVDLFRAVRQGIRASVESYSIKKLEPLFHVQRLPAPESELTVIVTPKPIAQS